MSKRTISIVHQNVAQWHRDRAIRAWENGRWDVYTRHIRIADRLMRR